MTVTQTGGAQIVQMTYVGTTVSTTPPMVATVQNETQTVNMYP